MPSLTTLDPALVPWAEALYEHGRRVDPRLRVTSARRTYAEQLALYQRATRGQNAGLPAARPGTSMHERGLAFDLARPGIDPRSDPLLAWLGAVWKSWGGHWPGAADPVHFSVSRG